MGEQAFEEILAEIDGNATGRVEKWTEKRRSERKRIRLECVVRYIFPQTDTARTATGRTRDLSTTGMAVLSDIHFLRRTSVAITVPLHDGRKKQVCGKVTYSRLVREGWFLTGIQFGPVTDKRLTTAQNGPVAGNGIGDGGREQSKSSPRRPTPTKTRTNRDRALATLSAVRIAKSHTREAMTNLAAMSVSQDHVIRKATIPVFLELGNRDGVLGLIGLLKDANSDIQGDAADALGALRAPEATSALKKLTKTGDAKAALRAATALGRLGDRSGLALVVGYLKEGGQHAKLAARALGAIVGQDFRPTRQGVAAARRYAKAEKL